MNNSPSQPLTRFSRSYGVRAADTKWLTLRNYWWMLAALALAFALRANQLAVQSLWNDEGTSIALSRLSLTAIANGAAHDIHPPLYYFLLHFWMQITGDPSPGAGEFAMRFLSVMAGVLVVAVTFRVARELFDQEVAVIAALLSAASAFQVYYSQETRMYMLVTLFGALSVWAMVVMLKPAAPSSTARPLELGEVGSSAQNDRNAARAAGIRHRTIAWVGFIVATTAALYTHYFAFTLVAFENLAFVAWLVWAIRVRRPGIGHSIAFWVAAQVIVAVAFVPWLLYAGNQLTNWPAISDALSLPELVGRVLSAFVLGIDTPVQVQVVIVAAFGIFFLIGLLPSLDLFQQSWWGIVLAALWAVIPLAAMFVVSLQRPDYNPKFLLLATPGFLILLARGLSILYPGIFLPERAPRMNAGTHGLTRSLMSWRFLLSVGVITAGAVISLRMVYFDPRLQRDDYRGIIRYINAVATKDDAVLIDAPGQIDVFRYYYRGAAPVTILPIGRPLEIGPTGAALSDLVDTHGNLYAIYWATEQADPDRMVEHYLAVNAFKASDDWHGNVRLAQYALPPYAQQFPAGVRFGREIELNDFDLDTRPVHAGQILSLSLNWVALQRPSTNFKVFVHLLDGKGRIISQHDGEPVDGFRPTGSWNKGDVIADNIGVLIYPGTPPGNYTVEFGLYRADDGTRLRVINGDDHVALGTLTVEKTISPRDALALTRSVNLGLGDIALVGYDLPRAEFSRGDTIVLVLYWQALVKPRTDAAANIELRDGRGNIVAQQHALELYPSSDWDASEVVREVYTFPIPADAPPGEYNIAVVDALGARLQEIARVQLD